jgi:hypothetical protein
MWTIRKIPAIILILLSGSFYTHAQNMQRDSVRDMEKKVKADLREIKAKKARQIKRIDTKDSTVIYASDKQRTHIVHVTSFNRLEKRKMQFSYNENAVVLIVVLKGTRLGNNSGYKKKTSGYYFDNRRLIRSRNGDTEDDISFLLSEADRFLRQGKALL